MRILDISQNKSCQDVVGFVHSGEKLALPHEAISRLENVRNYLDQKSTENGAPIYGVNTGFGSLCDTVIAPDDLSTLQKNLLLSHACGMGEEVPHHIVKLMLLLKIRGLLYGHSGVQSATVGLLVQFYNHDILPVVYTQGSLGASGDLAPLSHLSLPLIGCGEVYFNGEKVASMKALDACHLKPITLKSKEGLALINGTQFMSAYATWCVAEGERLLERSLAIAALSVDGYDARLDPFHPLVHAIRPHAGQRYVAQRMLDILSGSSIALQPKKHVQDPYSFRCIPQVLGASFDALRHVKSVVETELNSVTDNPLIFSETDQVISGGNFHGQPLALVLDFLAIALAEAGSISERRTYKLIGGQRGLPAYLADDAGLNSGYMIPQYTAASIVSQNKQLCTPASVDSIDSSNGQEDHVSMGANAATKCARVLDNFKKILAIEWLTASQALDLRRPMKSSEVIEKLHASLRSEIPYHSKDVYQSERMQKAASLV
ncbi:MAG: histidine ammonia-lyase [Flavobacteriales bacterium]